MSASVIPPELLKGRQPLQKRIICHWTVTGYQPDEACLDSYHFLISWDGTKAKIVPGNGNIDEPMPHTYMFNSAIGVAICAVGGYRWSQGHYSPFPIKGHQWEVLVNAVRQLCNTYNIPVDRQHVLMHGEVTDVLGVDQWGKWDIGWLPHLNLDGAERCGQELRRQVLTTTATDTKNPIITYRLQNSTSLLKGFLSDGMGMLPIRAFVNYLKDQGIQIGLTPNADRTVTLSGSGLGSAYHFPYVTEGVVGYVEARKVVEWLGWVIETETWAKEKKVLTIKKKDG